MNTADEQDALLEAIFRTPGDDTPRLVYADWIEEHGEPEYAEFIRLQIACANEPNPGPRKPLERREREVWKKLKRKWRDLLAPPTVVRKDDFRRGFVSGSVEGACRIPADLFLERSADLWPRIPLRCVELAPANGSIAFPTAVLDCAHLRRLTRLELDSGWNKCPEEEFAVQLFSRDPFDRLLELKTRHIPLSRPVIEALRTAPYMPRMRHLDIGYAGLNGSTPYGNGGLYFTSGEKYSKYEGAVAMLAKELPALEPHFVVVPPGETSQDQLVAHTRSLNTTAP